MVAAHLLWLLPPGIAGFASKPYGCSQKQSWSRENLWVQQMHRETGANRALTDHSTAKMGSGNQQNLPGIVKI